MTAAPKMQNPGPGHYEDNKGLEQVVNRKTAGKNGTFGCTERRFAPKNGGIQVS